MRHAVDIVIYYAVLYLLRYANNINLNFYFSRPSRRGGLSGGRTRHAPGVLYLEGAREIEKCKISLKKIEFQRNITICFKFGALFNQI